MVKENELNKKEKFFNRFLFKIEVLGNKIPDPMILFLFFSVTTIVLSFILSKIGFSAVNPATNKTVEVFNLLSREGISRMLVSAISNFTKLPALGMVLVCMLGVGVCDRSGLFSVGLKNMVANSKGSDLKIITIFVFASVMADATGGTGFVVMPPLGALIFSAMGRNPLAGMFCAYASVSGAFASNLLITSMDIVNLSFTEAAAKLVDSNIVLSPAINYYFSAFSVIILNIISVLVTIKIVEPRLGLLKEKSEQQACNITDLEKKAMKPTCISIFLYILVLIVCSIPENSVFRDMKTGSLFASAAPLMKSLPLLIAFLFLIPGIVFGLKSKNFKNSKDIVKALGEAMADMGPYIALIFVIAQFLSYFAWSNMGIILAIKGAMFLKNSGFPILVILILFIIMSSFINLVIGSASTKWAILSPIFVPMFMFLGYHPGMTQMAYRIGDAISNPICPTFAYFGMLLALAQKYDKNAGIGTLMANMLPYTIAFFICMVLQFIVWFIFEIPFGPGAPLFL